MESDLTEKLVETPADGSDTGKAPEASGEVAGDDEFLVEELEPDPSNAGPFTRGEKQPTRCRDPIFALLFYGNVAAIVVCAIVYGPRAFDDSYSAGGIQESTDSSGWMKVAAVTGVVSLILSGIALLVMIGIAEFLIMTALIVNVALSLVMAILGFASGQTYLGILGLVFFIIGTCYACVVWSRIPFATANLVTALTAVKANLGLTLVAYFFAFLSIGWYLLWVVALLGILVDETCDPSTGICQGQVNGGVLFALFLSFFFTAQVIQNCVHATVAGTVGTWWFVPNEASSCCSMAVLGATFRTLTTSFGSICFGSLLVAFIQALQQLAYSMRNDNNAILLCIADCILSCLENLLEYFNKWAFVYVGLYGYPYLQAGQNVFELFRNRGWEAIIADDLVGRVLALVSIAIGLLSGGIGSAFYIKTDWFPKTETQHDVWVGFVFGLTVGIFVTSVLMSVVGSAVNTVIVCFAEGPSEFQVNHPELSNKMRSTWIATFPGCLRTA